MSYFKNLPYISYQFPDNGSRLFKDMSIRPDIVEELVGDDTNLQVYNVESGETPETIAFDVYGDETLHWVILLANRIMNVYNEWPMSDGMLEDFIYEKYRTQPDTNGVDRELNDTQVYEFISFVGSPENSYSSYINLQDSDDSPKVVIRPKHFIDEDQEVYTYRSAFSTTDAFGRLIADLPTLTPVSYETYEVSLNDAKRQIYIPSRSIATRMKNDFKRLVNG